MEKIDLIFTYTDTGNCRAYFKDENRYLYCIQEEMYNCFSFYRCSKDGEPSYQINKDQFCIPIIKIKNDKFVERINNYIKT
jgi:hypothetical protein